MRLFVAVDLDEAARAAIAAEQKRVAAAMGDARTSVRWVKADHLHLTLVFLGEVPEAQAAKVAGTVARPLDASPFDLIFRGIGVFPARGSPRAVWIGVTDGAAELTAFQHALSERVAGEGIALESRPFQPHLTLGRWRQSRPSDRARALAASDSRIVARSHVSCATLYHSRISSAGPTYTALSRATLTGG
jgi:RNA 2',3'-cyclic 3'-phosphodiesterase